LKSWLEDTYSKITPKSPTGKAIAYSLNNWNHLSAFLLDGRLDISNNKAERGIKHFVIGRKNFLFSDSAEGADSCGITYSIVETAKANNLNPQKYLEFLLEELSRNRQTPEKLEEVMPWSDKIPEEIKVKNPIIK